jgi:hypothetical protein
MSDPYDSDDLAPESKKAAAIMKQHIKKPKKVESEPESEPESESEIEPEIEEPKKKPKTLSGQAYKDAKKKNFDKKLVNASAVVEEDAYQKTQIKMRSGDKVRKSESIAYFDTGALPADVSEDVMRKQLSRHIGGYKKELEMLKMQVLINTIENNGLKKELRKIWLTLNYCEPEE